MTYKVIYADPPWQYKNKKTGGGHKSGASQKYGEMSLKDLKELPVLDLADDDAVLFMWTTCPMIHEALHLVEAWGFRYIGMVTWNKTGRLGMGYWLRVNTEHLIYAVKPGAKCWRSAKMNRLEAKVQKHSSKPEVFRDLIDFLCPEGPKLELFARERALGWDAWGDDVNGGSDAVF